MRLRRLAVLVLVSLTVAPATEAFEAPLPRVDLALRGPTSGVWTPHAAHVNATRVRLNGLGARTHANWILFRLPFDTSQFKRIRVLRWQVSATADTDVGALRIGSVCLAVDPSGGANDWSRFTSSGIGGTHRFERHPAPPTDDPTIFAINVPTRVANYVACGWGNGILRDPTSWALDVEWEDR